MQQDMTETQAKRAVFYARLADPTIPPNEWKWYQRGEVSPEMAARAAESRKERDC